MSKTIIKRNAILPYSPRQMFELVDAIEDYPLFLPWCSKTHVIHRDEKVVEASLTLTFSGISKSFTTRNELSPYERIDITLIHGPFRHLEGIWKFTPHSEGCQIELELEFEFSGFIFDRIFEPIFHHIANSLVELFSKRAVEVYGSGKED